MIRPLRATAERRPGSRRSIGTNVGIGQTLAAAGLAPVIVDCDAGTLELHCALLRRSRLLPRPRPLLADREATAGAVRDGHSPDGPPVVVAARGGRARPPPGSGDAGPIGRRGDRRGGGHHRCAGGEESRSPMPDTMTDTMTVSVPDTAVPGTVTDTAVPDTMTDTAVPGTMTDTAMTGTVTDTMTGTMTGTTTDTTTGTTTGTMTGTMTGTVEHTGTTTVEVFSVGRLREVLDSLSDDTELNLGVVDHHHFNTLLGTMSITSARVLTSPGLATLILHVPTF